MTSAETFFLAWTIMCIVVMAIGLRMGRYQANGAKAEPPPSAPL